MNLNKNKINLKGIEVPDYARSGVSSEEIIYEAGPRQYRFSGEVGEFMRGEERIGVSLSLQVFDFRWSYGRRWAYPAQSWLDVAFLDNDGVISVCAFKKESALNLFEFLLDLKIQKLSPLSIWVELTAVARIVEEETYTYYYVADIFYWDFVSQERFEDLSQFAKSGKFEWILSGEAGEPKEATNG